MGVNSTCGLTYFADLDFGSVRDSLVDYKEGSPVDPTWLPFGNFLVQHTGKTLLLWNVFGVVGFGNNQVGQENETEDSRGATITTCLDGYDPEFPLIFLHSYAYYDDNLEPSTTVAGALVKVALVVGVSAIQSMTFVWKLEFDQGIFGR